VRHLTPVIDPPPLVVRIVAGVILSLLAIFAIGRAADGAGPHASAPTVTIPTPATN
jgi:hypothetical protein